MKFLSIITICFNDPVGLKKTLESCQPLVEILGVSYEHLVIDSSPKVHEAIRSDPRFQNVRWTEEPPSGIYPAINSGNRQATGQYVWHLHAGDSLGNPAILVEALAALKINPDVALLFSPVLFYKDDVFLRTHRVLPEFKKNMIGRISICHQGVLIKRNCFTKYGEFSTDYRFLSDFDFWRRLVNGNETFLFFDKPFAHFDLGGVSAQNSEKVVLEFFKILIKLRMSVSEKILSAVNYTGLIFKYFILFPILRMTRLYAAARWVYRHLNLDFKRSNS